MASATLEKQQAYLRLNNGTSASGTIQTVSVSLGTLNASNWDADKALAVADKLEACLTKTIYQFQGVSTTTYRAS